MTDGWIRVLVEAIHSSPTQSVLYLAGGASQALGWLMSVPGASNTILEAVVPYSRVSMTQLLSKTPTQFTSQQTVEELSLRAYNRALKLSTKPGFPVLGVGFTGSLASLDPKRGDHRFYLSTRTSDRLWVSKVTLSKGLRTREQEDKVSSQLLVKRMVIPPTKKYLKDEDLGSKNALKAWSFEDVQMDWCNTRVKVMTDISEAGNLSKQIMYNNQREFVGRLTFLGSIAEPFREYFRFE
ncbi:hypothetical protein GIB67_036434 [Kingdonia uniflora]|uniref:Uncharacterized protein n=1 Tax=Kingdonia uniflora TaxID=39325 RepID=A0A7J7L466_9MAGN|nr:hypothetical protein GIB67_036434 [Kingdonia uniflora]